MRLISSYYLVSSIGLGRCKN